MREKPDKLTPEDAERLQEEAEHLGELKRDAEMFREEPTTYDKIAELGITSMRSTKSSAGNWHVTVGRAGTTGVGTGVTLQTAIEIALEDFRRK